MRWALPASGRRPYRHLHRPTDANRYRLDNLSTLLNSVNGNDLQTFESWLASAFIGTGPGLHQIITTGQELFNSLAAAQPETVNLVNYGNTDLHTLRATSGDFESFAKSLASFTGQLATSNGDLRDLIKNASAAANTVGPFLASNNPEIEALIANFATDSQAAHVYQPAVEALFQILPVVASRAAGALSGGQAHAEAAFNIGQPVCAYVPETLIHGPTQLTGAAEARQRLFDQEPRHAPARGIQLAGRVRQMRRHAMVLILAPLLVFAAACGPVRGSVASRPQSKLQIASAELISSLPLASAMNLPPLKPDCIPSSTGSQPQIGVYATFSGTATIKSPYGPIANATLSGSVCGIATVINRPTNACTSPPGQYASLHLNLPADGEHIEIPAVNVTMFPNLSIPITHITVVPTAITATVCAVAAPGPIKQTVTASLPANAQTFGASACSRHRPVGQIYGPLGGFTITGTNLPFVIPPLKSSPSCPSNLTSVADKAAGPSARTTRERDHH